MQRGGFGRRLRCKVWRAGGCARGSSQLQKSTSGTWPEHPRRRVGQVSGPSPRQAGESVSEAGTRRPSREHQWRPPILAPTRQQRDRAGRIRRWKAFRARKAAALACRLWNGLLVPSGAIRPEWSNGQGGATGNVRSPIRHLAPGRTSRTPGRPRQSRATVRTAADGRGLQLARAVPNAAPLGSEMPSRLFDALVDGGIVPALEEQPAKWGGPRSGGPHGASRRSESVSSPGCS